MRHATTRAASVALVLSFAACAGDSPTATEGANLAIEVAPLSLTGLTDATYTVSVYNGGDDLVWQKTLTSTAYGDGAGSVSYVGTCDADPAAQPNRVELVVDGLEDAGGALVAGSDFANPAPAGSPLVKTAICVADTDVPVQFDVTLARAAQQGFFDVAVSLADIFCSAKLDCERSPGVPIELLHDATGARGPTAVVAFACTGGPGSDTWLYMSPLTVDCGGTVTTIDPTLGPGNLTGVAGSGLPTAAIFQAQVTHGTELLGNYDKKYWNVALGLDAVTGCTLDLTATASDGPLTDGETPADVRWPTVAWSGALDACTQHGLDSGDGVVTTTYTAPTGATFENYFDGSTAAPFVFDIAMAGTLSVGDPGRWSDGTYAPSCDAYRNPTGLYVYGDEGDGYYTIDPDGVGAGYSAFTVYCDMTTDGGGWTGIARCDARTYLNGTLTPIEGASVMGFDAASCRPYGGPDGGGGYTGYYDFDFPAGFTQFYLSSYTFQSATGVFDVGATNFAMTTWTSLTSITGWEDMGLGSGADASPVIPLTSAQGGASVQYSAGSINAWPGGATVYAMPGARTSFRIGWGQNGGENEAVYPWYDGLIMLR